MIASTKRDQTPTTVDDPRRSYDRGSWVGELAGESNAGDQPPAAAPIDLASISLDALRRELDRREKDRQVLLAKRERLAAELAALDAEIRKLQAADVPPAPATRSGQRAKLILPRLKNSVSLPDALAMAVEQRAVVSPTEAAQLVRANGFLTTSKTFVAAVSNALSRDERFRRIGRGRYERVDVSHA